MSEVLTGQVAVVTGGGRGIGRAVALAFSESGAAVAITARSEHELDETVQLIERGGGRAFAVPADVTDEDAMRHVVAEAERRFGPVDVLVNNAGLVGPLGPIWEVDAEAWRRCMDVNVLGPLFGLRAVLPGMIDRGKGRVINVSTGAGVRPMQYASAYSASKTALLRLTESVAAETKEHGISVFAISPGLVRTAMPESIANSEAGQKWLPRFAAGALDNAIPPERPAALCVLLASGIADALSGRLLSVNDDIPALASQAARILQDDLYMLRLNSLPASSR